MLLILNNYYKLLIEVIKIRQQSKLVDYKISTCTIHNGLIYD